jgi:uncharacterized DUF497 family protein
MRISGFDWDEGNVVRLALGHGIEPKAAEQVFAVSASYRRTTRGHYAAFGPTQACRLLVIVFEMKAGGMTRVITGWDVNRQERRYYQQERRE